MRRLGVCHVTMPCPRSRSPLARCPETDWVLVPKPECGAHIAARRAAPRTAPRRAAARHTASCGLAHGETCRVLGGQHELPPNRVSVVDKRSWVNNQKVLFLFIWIHFPGSQCWDTCVEPSEPISCCSMTPDIWHLILTIAWKLDLDMQMFVQTGSKNVRFSETCSLPPEVNEKSVHQSLFVVLFTSLYCRCRYWASAAGDGTKIKIAFHHNKNFAHF